MNNFNSFPDHNMARPLGSPKFKVTYNLNAPDVNIYDTPHDNNTYCRNETVSVVPYTGRFFTSCGCWSYTFQGWSYNKEGTIDSLVEDTFVIHKDTTLYAVWSVEQTLEVVYVTGNSGVRIKPDYKDALEYLRLPEYYGPHPLSGGPRIKRILPNAFDGSTITTIVIPANIIHIDNTGFKNWQGRELRFIDQTITEKYPPLAIATGAFENNMFLSQIILPYRFNEIVEVSGYNSIFGSDSGLERTIKIRRTKENLAESTNKQVAHINNLISKETNDYVLNLHWGYND